MPSRKKNSFSAERKRSITTNLKSGSALYLVEPSGRVNYLHTFFLWVHSPSHRQLKNTVNQPHKSKKASSWKIKIYANQHTAEAITLVFIFQLSRGNTVCFLYGTF